MLNRLKFFMMAYLILFSFSVFAAEIISPKIIGGTAVSDGELPFVVALLNVSKGRSEYDQQFCGGTLISSEWVVTAAHCLEDFNGNYTNLRILAGATTLSRITSGTHETRLVSEAYIHENFNNFTFNNDIALIRMAAPVTVTPVDYVSTASAPYYTEPEPELEGTDAYKAYVAGWGDTTASSMTSEYPVTMEMTDVGIVNFETCSAAYAGYSAYPTSNTICAGYAEGGKDSCQGDSGGPLFTNTGSGKAFIGIVSNGNGCAQPNYYGMYTKVKNYESWISSKTGSSINNSVTQTSQATINGTSIALQTSFSGISSMTYYNYAASDLTSDDYIFDGKIDFEAVLASGYTSTVVQLYMPGIDISKIKLLKCEEGLESGSAGCSEIDVTRDTSAGIISYVVADGGIYDTDTRSQYIADPVYIARENTTPAASSESSNGGCSAAGSGSPVSFIMLFAAVSIYFIYRRKTS